MLASSQYIFSVEEIVYRRHCIYKFRVNDSSLITEAYHDRGMNVPGKKRNTERSVLSTATDRHRSKPIYDMY